MLFREFYSDSKGHLCKEFFKVAVGPFKNGEKQGYRARAVISGGSIPKSFPVIRNFIMCFDTMLTRQSHKKATKSVSFHHTRTSTPPSSGHQPISKSISLLQAAPSAPSLFLIPSDFQCQFQFSPFFSASAVQPFSWLGQSDYQFDIIALNHESGVNLREYCSKFEMNRNY